MPREESIEMLAKRPGPIVPFIAETGGQNAMIVDSSALPEQVVADALTSAFDSAGQRCSALRLLYVQDDIAPRLLPLQFAHPKRVLAFRALCAAALRLYAGLGERESRIGA